MTISIAPLTTLHPVSAVLPGAMLMTGLSDGMVGPSSKSPFTSRSARDAWAVGYYHTPGALGLKTLVEHWNGTAWTQVPSLNPSPAPFTNRLIAVAATSPSNVWAVGDYIGSARPHATLTLVEHWNGTTWTQVPSPSPSPGPGRFNDLDGVAANSASNAWAVGEYVTSSQAQQALAFHCC